MPGRRTSSEGSPSVGAGRTGFVPHRLSALVLLFLLALTVAGHLVARSIVDRHERDLLDQEADEIAALFDQLGAAYQANIVGIATVADATGGDAARFAADVGSAEPGGAWSLLRRTVAGLEVVTTIGQASVDITDPPDTWAPLLDDLESDAFAVLGLAGDGADRRLGLAARAGDMVVYHEVALFEAAIQSAGTFSERSAASSYGSFDIAVYVDEVSAEGFVFQTSEPGRDAVRRVVAVGGTDITLVIGHQGALGGSLISWWPTMVVAFGVVASLGMAITVELSLRRHDDALHQVDALAAKNRALDTALEELRTAETTAAAVEAELRQMQRLESVGQLAGGVAHDFNNLLAVILSYADLIDHELDAGDPVASRADLEQIREAARRGADLTHRLLQFSRQHEEDVGVVDVGKLVGDLVPVLETRVGTNVSLRTHLDDGGATVLVDPHSLDQAILNLVLNSRDAIAGQGTITITTASVEIDDQQAARMPDVEPGRFVRICVIDDGRGMPEDVRRRSFDPFFTTKGRGRGTGLGLATVYGMVQAHGGHVSIESEVGTGSTVTLLLPQADQDAVRDRPVAKAPAPADRAARLLLVEDEPAVRSAVRRMLSGAGHDVVEAPDGHEAVARFGTTDLDLLVTDIVMPGEVDGAEVAARLRVHDPELPVVFITGYGVDALDERGIVVDTTHTLVVHKPFTEDQLVAAVDRLLGRSSG